jgi:hypothetical protein
MTELPNFFTVEEAAEIVRIGRTLAYQQAARYEATGGAEGLPVVRIGRLLRVPRARLEAWAGAPLAVSTADTIRDPTATSPAPLTPTPQRPRPSRSGRTEQQASFPSAS